MGTTTYFDETVTDDATNDEFSVDIGTSGYAGNGPQMYLTFEGKTVIFSHKDAQAFCAAVSRIAGYFSYPET
ncbi:hypothetical protein [Mesorhizobium huakuii]|uniref:KTSC domain-containing protein n=1 Tax=Mesorhizobium huakuii TaxID=28104 RepID=A0ABZ0VS90_9HYPH|nr:hypothetical protein [Mesorhizobium huakuii]WQB99536.1 hypothetical protein U0R22_003717 [Mesorhizobium huakuii]